MSTRLYGVCVFGWHLFMGVMEYIAYPRRSIPCLLWIAFYEHSFVFGLIPGMWDSPSAVHLLDTVG
jgi:hypothetical protein